MYAIYLNQAVIMYGNNESELKEYAAIIEGANVGINNMLSAR